MATNGLMKTEVVPLPSKKNGVTTTTEEICYLPAEPKATPPSVKDPNVCYLPAPKFESELKALKMSKEFECEYPSVEPNVYRTRDPLPFPDNLHDLISWTDAFVDRIASMTQAEEKKNSSEVQRLIERISRLETDRDLNAVELEKARTKAKTAEGKVDELTQKLKNAEDTAKARKHTINNMKKDAEKKEKHDIELHHKIDGLEKDLDKAKAANIKLMKEFAKANKEAADRFAAEHAGHIGHHKEIGDLRKQLGDEKAKNAELVKEVAGLRDELTTVKHELESSNTANQNLICKIETLETKIDAMNKFSIELQDRIKSLTEDLANANHALDAARKTISDLSGEVVAAKERICTLDQEIVKAKEENATLTKERDAALAASAERKTSLDNLTKEHETLKTKCDTISKSLIQSGKEKQAEIDQRKQAEADKEKELKEVKDKLEKELQQVKDKADEELKTHEEELNGYRAIAEGNVKPEQLAEAESKLAEATKSLTTAQTSLATAESKAQELEAKLKAAEKRLIPNPKNRKINILTVEYGGRAYTPEKYPEVFTKLYAAADKRAKFTVDNDLFGGRSQDPWPRHCKSFSITYQLNSEGAPRHLSGREDEEACFEGCHD